MEKIYILDTNVLIQAPYAVECFEENEVVLPMTVLEELDNLKKEEGEKGANVRRVIRILDAYREKARVAAAKQRDTLSLRFLIHKFREYNPVLREENTRNP